MRYPKIIRIMFEKDYECINSLCDVFRKLGYNIYFDDEGKSWTDLIISKKKIKKYEKP